MTQTINLLFLIKDRKGRGCEITKDYLTLYVCFSTKVLHLELTPLELLLLLYYHFIVTVVSFKAYTSHHYCDQQLIYKKLWCLETNGKATNFHTLFPHNNPLLYILQVKLEWEYLISYIDWSVSGVINHNLVRKLINKSFCVVFFDL